MQHTLPPLADLARATLLDLAPARLLAGARRRLPDLGHYRQVLVLAYGKAAVSMAQAASQWITPAAPPAHLIVAAPEAYLAPGQSAAPWASVQNFVAGHPEPNAASLAAAGAMLAAIGALPHSSFVLHLVSGGGSALVEAPLDARLSLDDLQAAYRALVLSGAPIDRINVVRKHLSAFKGGRLAAAAAAGADQVTFLISDVPAGDLSSVASGPSLPDASTLADCRRLLADFPIALPPAVAAALADANLGETPKADHPAFARSRWHLLMDDRSAAQCLAHHARAAGLAPTLDHGTDEWDYRDAARHLLDRIRTLKRADARACLIAAGEVRVAVPASARGRGGRNQHFALECARQMAGENLTLLSLATDGADGNSPAAGALVDGTIAARAAARGLSLEAALAGFDSYPLLAALDAAIELGPTGTNLRDLRIFA